MSTQRVQYLSGVQRSRELVLAGAAAHTPPRESPTPPVATVSVASPSGVLVGEPVREEHAGTASTWWDRPIIAEAGIAKMNLYGHFPSKDDLVVAYLVESNRQFWEWLEGATAGVDDPADRPVAMFEAIEKLSVSPECFDCTFQGTAAEFPDRDHPGHQIALTHKKEVRDSPSWLQRRVSATPTNSATSCCC
jgi:hypothetical protein